MTRAFNAERQSVYHQYFTLDSSFQGSGIGKNLFKALYKQYKSAGIKSIGVGANISVGGYAWGRYGFTSTRETARNYVRQFERNVGRRRGGSTISQLDASKAQRVFDDFYNDHRADERFPMNLLCCIGTNNKAGKGILKGTSWGGKLDLTNTAQRSHFENYIGFSG